MFLVELMKLLKKKEANFLERVMDDHGHFIVKLQKPFGFDYKAGQHGLFTLESKKKKKKTTHMFSLASAPEEDVLLLGTKTNYPISLFKQSMLELKEGDTIRFRGMFGSFVFKDQSSPVVMIALGVGVTPIRSLLMHAKNWHLGEIEVVYSAKDTYLFKEELEKLTHEHKTIHVSFLKSYEETKVAYQDLVKRYSNKAYYYISGSPKGIQSIRKNLRESGIKKKRIIHDPFYGYKS
jgi:ferredoxin-NADP reductase